MPDYQVILMQIIQEMESRKKYGLFSLPVIIAGLGYFVDIYDLTIFGILRVPSLLDLGLNQNEVSSIGTLIYNAQLFGLIIGGFIWGIIGDKYGRRNILFGSILVYSVANIANAFVDSSQAYTIWRFIAGVGLAGELGAGITLIAEIVKKESRSYATSLVTGIGLLGAVVAYFTYELTSWRIAYIVGGVLGLILLATRFKFLESSIFIKAKESLSIQKRGNIFTLLFNKRNLINYLSCIGVAIPIYFFYGIFAAFSNEIGKALNLNGEIIAGQAVVWCYAGLSLGDLLSGPISAYFKSRKKVILVMMLLVFVASLLITAFTKTTFMYYLLVFLGGIFSGYWALFMIMTSESFPTSIRATATTSAPNMVRGALILVLMLYQYLKDDFDVITSSLIVGGVCLFIALLSYIMLKETFNKDLDFTE